MRLFFAVELSSDVQAALGRLNPDDPSRDYRWSDPALLHVTLAFLGQQRADRLDGLRSIGAAAASACRPGTLKLGQPGSFGPRGAPRVLWIGLDGDLAALQALQSRLAAGLREAGFELEERPFSPHITLARRRESARGGAPPGWPPSNPPSQNTEFPMQRLTLFESRLSPRGATYIPLRRFSSALTAVATRLIVPGTVKDADQDEYASGRAQRAGVGVNRCLARR
jgi:2'-5' RNA ligase